MKIHRVTPTDDRLNRLRVEFSGEDMDLISGLVERLDALAEIEDVLGVKGWVSPFIGGEDLPTITREGATFLRTLTDGWDGDDATPPVWVGVEADSI